MKTLQVTEEIKQLFEEAEAARDCRDRAVAVWFFTQKAIRFGRIANKKSRRAWELINTLYPITRNSPWHYDYASGGLREGHK